MSEDKESPTQARLVFDNPSPESGAGSIYAEHVEIDIREPRHDNRNTTRFTPEQVEQLRKKVRDQDTARYFAIKVTLCAYNKVFSLLLNKSCNY